MSDDSSAQFGHDPDIPDASGQPEPGHIDAQPLDSIASPEETELEPEESDPPSVLLDAHSQPVGAVDAHSVPAAPGPPPTAADISAPVPVAGEQQTPSAPAEMADRQTAAKPAAAAVQATQAVVGTAKQATQQVTAAVQQQAQKITVAPRKAIYRGKRFLAIYGGLVGTAGLMAFLARRHRYFVGDVGIARLVQRPNSKTYDELMRLVSQLGWRWTSVGTRASLVTLMWAAGFRMESAFTLSTWSGDLLAGAIKTGVLRPRPTSDLVRVMSKLEEASFPSGHVVHYVTFYGFLFYLVFTHLKRRWFRTALLTLLAGLILLVGPSRIYMGHHWPSDVGGAYLVGTLWLGLIIIAYLETKANYTLHTNPPFLVKRAKQLK